VLLLARRGVATAGREMMGPEGGDGRGVGVPPPAEESCGLRWAEGSAVRAAAVGGGAAGGSDAAGWAGAGGRAPEPRSGAKGAGGAGRGGLSGLVTGEDRGSRLVEEWLSPAGARGGGNRRHRRARGVQRRQVGTCPAGAGRSSVPRRMDAGGPSRCPNGGGTGSADGPVPERWKRGRGSVACGPHGDQGTAESPPGPLASGGSGAEESAMVNGGGDGSRQSCPGRNQGGGA
jgi:hypothetical protein